MISVLRTAAVLLLLVAVSQPGSSQDVPIEGVLLHGWALPEGSVTTSSTHVLRRAQVRFYHTAEAAMPDTSTGPVRVLEVYTSRQDSVRTTFVELGEDGPRRVEHHVWVSDILEDVHEGDEIVERGRRPTPLSGTHYAAELPEEGSWVRRFLRPENPTDDQIAALEQVRFAFKTPQYPARPVSVGETWDLTREDLTERFGSLEPEHPQRMTFRLDSTGTYMNRPAAFVSYGLDITTRSADGVVMERNEVGVVVRLLDRLVDVHEQRQGTFRTTRSGAFEDGQPYFSVMEGEIRGVDQHFLTIPVAQPRDSESASP